jgi:hypothetical protein
MRNIRKYDTLTEYEADAAAIAAVSGFVVSVVTGTGIKYDGENLIAPLSAAQEADIVVFDKDELDYKVVKFGTYDSATFPSKYVIGGVVFAREGDVVKIMAKDKLGSARYAQGYKVKLTGFNFATGGSFDISLADRETKSGTINYTTSDTLGSVATAINALAHSRFSAVASETYNCITIEHNDYSAPTITISNSSPTITMTELAGKYQTTYVDTILDNGIIKPGSIVRNKGLSTSYAGGNFAKFKAYYSASGSTTAGLSETSSDILRQSAFNATDNPVLYAKYGGDYDAYLMSEMLAWPCGRGIIRQFDSQLMTYALAAKTWVDVDGTIKPAYPSAAAHAAYGIATEGYITGFEPGKWCCGSVYDLWLTIRDRNLAGNDDVNLSLSAVGGTKHLVSDYYWSCCEYNSSNSWFYDGGSGRMSHNSKCYSSSGRPLLALKITN